MISIDLSKPNHDVSGNDNEEVIKYIMVGKILCQFFTEALIKNDGKMNRPKNISQWKN